MTRTLPGAWVVAWGLVGGAPLPAPAQEADPPREPTRSVGIRVSPGLRLDETTCCSGLGLWLQVGRFQIDHSFGINTWRFDLGQSLYGHAMTVLFDVKTWRTRDYVARFRAGGGYRMRLYHASFRHRTSTDHWGTVNVGLTFDFEIGKRGVVRAGFAGSRPLSVEPHLGAGWRF